MNEQNHPTCSEIVHRRQAEFMRNLDKLLSQLGIIDKNPTIQKKVLRKVLLTEREVLFSATAPENWGPKQFQSVLTHLGAQGVNDLQKKYLVASYFPIRAELQVDFFANSQVIFPKMTTQGALKWFEYGDGQTGYSTNKFGIKERDDAYCFSYSTAHPPMLCLVPAIAASVDGYRLGYGGGYYDRFLSAFTNKVTSVVCLPSNQFLFDTLPHNDLDQKASLIL